MVFAKTEGIAMNTIQSKALVGIGSIGEVPITLVKPQAYMNYSGESVCIGNPPGTVDMKAHLPQRFSTVDRHQIDAALDQGVEAVSTLVLNGFDQTITSFNLRQKYKYHKV
ncbi:hypothetical protein ACFX1Q_047021 [Malus domestica]